MNSQQTSLLASIDAASKVLNELVIQGVKMGIPKETMEAHARAYFTQNMGRELYRMFQKKELEKPADLFTTFLPTDGKSNIL